MEYVVFATLVYQIGLCGNVVT